MFSEIVHILFCIERRHWRICTFSLTSDFNSNWSETERARLVFLYRTFLQRAIYMWEFAPLKLLGLFSLNCPFREEIRNAKRNTRFVKPRFTIERVRSVFLTDFLQLIYTSQRSKRASSSTRVQPPDIDLALFSMSLFFCHTRDIERLLQTRWGSTGSDRLLQTGSTST